ncbi:CrcB family protein, partial [Bordetella pertussis]|uniref:CrcB family protein n=1 Tax=Bordetella pertussis TaxID=520 RepID=UPI000B07D3DE
MLTYAPLNFIAIGIGATLGAWLRWVLGLRLNGAGWPWGTLTANLVGGYLIGVMVALIASHPEWPAWIRLAGGWRPCACCCAEPGGGRQVSVRRGRAAEHD